MLFHKSAFYAVLGFALQHFNESRVAQRTSPVLVTTKSLPSYGPTTTLVT
ncbi:hypothetical protein ISN45_At01g034810 [Arabidopsis thaliana x Arabidopsis arenosa]|uniref:Uncharacterized protein n=1 Tax=Arabidopsis thaliana x Arabidopsis arenosa TaxID=1240361 RepID=A0A8T2GMQ4_9BRAS|nr:hypothetical protein ISN45_At01g034810 [Arabidopsis thaliana x Arabidopsis arenosa]